VEFIVLFLKRIPTSHKLEYTCLIEDFTTPNFSLLLKHKVHLVNLHRHSSTFINNTNTNFNSSEKELSPMQNQPPHKLYPKSTNCRAFYHTYTDQRFQIYVEELKMYIATHGHMNVTKKEHTSLHAWIQKIRTSYKSL